MFNPYFVTGIRLGGGWWIELLSLVMLSPWLLLLLFVVWDASCGLAAAVSAVCAEVGVFGVTNAVAAASDDNAVAGHAAVCVFGSVGVG